jgi:predicted DNA-binding transcriptional regulator AlpA
MLTMRAVDENGTGLSRSTLYRKIAEGTFPNPNQDQHPRDRLA